MGQRSERLKEVNKVLCKGRLMALFLALLIASCGAERVVDLQQLDASAASMKDDATGEFKEETGMKITSSAFAPNESIPSRYTCDDEDIIPPLKFEEVPQETASFALIMDDPDVPPPGSGRVWDHWVVWNIPPGTTEIEEGIAPQGVVGKNSWSRNDWGGPCPPDREHRYFFKLYALDTMLDLPPSSDKKALEEAMEGHVIEKAALMGRYDRQR